MPWWGWIVAVVLAIPSLILIGRVIIIWVFAEETDSER